MKKVYSQQKLPTYTITYNFMFNIYPNLMYHSSGHLSRGTVDHMSDTTISPVGPCLTLRACAVSVVDVHEEPEDTTWCSTELDIPDPVPPHMTKTVEVWSARVGDAIMLKTGQRPPQASYEFEQLFGFSHGEFRKNTIIRIPVECFLHSK